MKKLKQIQINHSDSEGKIYPTSPRSLILFQTYFKNLFYNINLLAILTLMSK